MLCDVKYFEARNNFGDRRCLSLELRDVIDANSEATANLDQIIIASAAGCEDMTALRSRLRF
jgi:hypothetical protein